MSNFAHRLYLSILVAIVFLTLIILFYMGISYYRISLDERFYHPAHNLLKPSGIIGHGMGILGSLLMLIGIITYMARKRYRFLSWRIVETLARISHFSLYVRPYMILFHTAFKFGGLVAISFWSMVAVFLSGIIGRFIYLQIPGSIEGRELSLIEVREMKSEVDEVFRRTF